MANIFHLTAGLPVARDGTADTGDNVFHMSAGLAAEVIASGTTLTSPADESTGVARPVTFTWQADSGATSYQLDLATDNTFTTNLQTFTQSATSKEVTGLTGSTTYYWRVRSNA